MRSTRPNDCATGTGPTSWSTRTESRAMKPHQPTAHPKKAQTPERWGRGVVQPNRALTRGKRPRALFISTLKRGLRARGDVISWLSPSAANWPPYLPHAPSVGLNERPRKPRHPFRHFSPVPPRRWGRGGRPRFSPFDDGLRPVLRFRGCSGGYDAPRALASPRPPELPLLEPRRPGMSRSYLICQEVRLGVPVLRALGKEAAPRASQRL